MKYSKRNVTTLLAKLRVLGLLEPAYWVSVPHPNYPQSQAIAMRCKYYSEMEEDEQKANWNEFKRYVHNTINQQETK